MEAGNGGREWKVNQKEQGVSNVGICDREGDPSRASTRVRRGAAHLNAEFKGVLENSAIEMNNIEM